MLVINYLNRYGVTDLQVTNITDRTLNFLDVNGDNRLAPLDALLVINFINRSPGQTEPVGEPYGAWGISAVEDEDDWDQALLDLVFSAQGFQ